MDTIKRTISYGAAMVLLGSQSLHAQVVDEEKALTVAAAYLYNFTKYVTWPAEAFEDQDAPIVIGVVGDERLADTLERMVRGKTVADRVLSIRRFAAGSGPDETWKECHVLFIGHVKQGKLLSVMDQLRDADVLIVGKGEEFARSGGMIALVLTDESIVFYINRAAIEGSRIKVSAKLLRLARKTYP